MFRKVFNLAQAALPRPGLMEIIHKATVLSLSCFMFDVSCVLHMRWQEQELKKKQSALEVSYCYLPAVIMLCHDHSSLCRVRHGACCMVHASCRFHMRWQEQELESKASAVEACCHLPGVVMLRFVIGLLSDGIC